MKDVLRQYIFELHTAGILSEGITVELDQLIQDIEGSMMFKVAIFTINKQRLDKLEYWEPWMLDMPIDVGDLLTETCTLSHANFYLKYEREYPTIIVRDVTSYLAAKAINYVELENSLSGLSVEYPYIAKNYCKNI